MKIITPKQISLKVLEIQQQNCQRVSSFSTRFANDVPLDNNIQHCAHKESVFDQRTTDHNAPLPFDAIPGPKGWPFFGTLFDYYKKDGLRFSKMFEAYRLRSLEYGPIYKEQLGPIQMIVISDPNEYSKIMRAEGRCPIRREMEPMAYYRKQKDLDLGLVNSQGDEWYRQRSAVSKHLLKLQGVAEFCLPIEQVSEELTSKLGILKNDNGIVNGLENEVFKWAMESIGIFLFEERIGCLKSNPSEKARDFIYHLKNYFRLMQPLMYNLPTYKIFRTKTWKHYEYHSNKVMEIGKTFVEKKMEAMKHGETGSTFLRELLGNKNLSMNDVTAMVVDLLMAAVETTSTVIFWSLYCLSKNQEAQEKLYQEVINVVGYGGRITPQALMKMPYLKATLKETFRIYPITYATSRILPAALEVAGYNIPAGSHVQANVYGMFRDKKLFQQTEVFRPERWLQESNMEPKLKSLSNLVWGHGARMCIGRRFAEQEIHILLAKMAQKFQMYNHGNVEPTLNTVMTPDRPLQIRFVSRQS